MASAGINPSAVHRDIRLDRRNRAGLTSKATDGFDPSAFAKRSMGLVLPASDDTIAALSRAGRAKLVS